MISERSIKTNLSFQVARITDASMTSLPQNPTKLGISLRLKSNKRPRSWSCAVDSRFSIEDNHILDNFILLKISYQKERLCYFWAYQNQCNRSLGIWAGDLPVGDVQLGRSTIGGCATWGTLTAPIFRIQFLF